jgi:hypothetical protein
VVFLTGLQDLQDFVSFLGGRGWAWFFLTGLQDLQDFLFGVCGLRQDYKIFRIFFLGWRILILSIL